MTFSELARELGETYSSGFGSRDKALADFGTRHSADLAAIERQGKTIEQLVDAARMSPSKFWAKTIRKGMR